jgi:hypothetical protein
MRGTAGLKKFLVGDQVATLYGFEEGKFFPSPFADLSYQRL